MFPWLASEIRVTFCPRVAPVACISPEGTVALLLGEMENTQAAAWSPPSLAQVFPALERSRVPASDRGPPHPPVIVYGIRPRAHATQCEASETASSYSSSVTGSKRPG